MLPLIPSRRCSWNATIGNSRGLPTQLSRLDKLSEVRKYFKPWLVESELVEFKVDLRMNSFDRLFFRT
jgi:hypothetical protein